MGLFEPVPGRLFERLELFGLARFPWQQQTLAMVTSLRCMFFTGCVFIRYFSGTKDE